MHNKIRRSPLYTIPKIDANPFDSWETKRWPNLSKSQSNCFQKLTVCFRTTDIRILNISTSGRRNTCIWNTRVSKLFLSLIQNFVKEIFQSSLVSYGGSTNTLKWDFVIGLFTYDNASSLPNCKQELLDFQFRSHRRNLMMWFNCVRNIIHGEFVTPPTNSWY